MAITPPLWGQHSTKIDKQELGLVARRERDRALGCDARAVPALQHDLSDLDASGHDVQPCGSTRGQAVHQVLSRLEHGRMDQRVLAKPERPPAPIRRRDHAQDATPVRRVEALLREARRELGFGLQKPDVKDPRPLRLRSIGLAVMDAGAGPDVLELARVHHPGATRGVFVGERAFEQVAHQLDVIPRPESHAGTG